MRWHRNVWVVTATSLLTDMSSEMIVHLLPLSLRSVLGAPVALIGLLDGIAETVSAVVKLSIPVFQLIVGLACAVRRLTQATQERWYDDVFPTAEHNQLINQIQAHARRRRCTASSPDVISHIQTPTITRDGRHQRHVQASNRRTPRKARQRYARVACRSV